MPSLHTPPTSLGCFPSDIISTIAFNLAFSRCEPRCSGTRVAASLLPAFFAALFFACLPANVKQIRGVASGSKDVVDPFSLLSRDS